MPEHFRRSLWINAGIIVLSFVVFGVLFVFMSQTLTGQATQILSDRSTIAARAMDVQDLANLKSDSATAMTYQKNINALLPIQDNLFDFQPYLKNLASSHSLSLTFNFTDSQTPPTASTPGIAPFTITVDGNANDIEGFITDLEVHNAQFLVTISEVNLTPNGSVYRADIVADVFFQQNPTPS